MEENLSDASLLLPNHAFATDGIAKLGRSTWDSYYSFGFVRNPWDRLVSWYEVIFNTPQPRDLPSNVHLNNALWNYARENADSFETFIKHCTDTITEDRDGFTYTKSFAKNQLDYFTDEQGKIATSFIGLHEHLHEDFDRIRKEVNLPDHPLPHRNESHRRDYRAYYTDETRDLVAERFARDIEYFGYSFGS